MVNIGTVSELHIIGHLKKIKIFMVFCIDQFANVPNAFPNRLNKHTRFGDKVKDERVFGMFLRFLRLPVRIRGK